MSGSVASHLRAALQQTPVGGAALSEGELKTLCESWQWRMIRKPTRETRGGGEAANRKDLKKPKNDEAPASEATNLTVFGVENRVETPPDSGLSFKL